MKRPHWYAVFVVDPADDDALPRYWFFNYRRNALKIARAQLSARFLVTIVEVPA